MSERIPKMLIIARLAFGGWLLVEFLSWAKVLPLTLEFTWLGLVIDEACPVADAFGTLLPLQTISAPIRRCVSAIRNPSSLVVIVAARTTRQFTTVARSL